MNLLRTRHKSFFSSEQQSRMVNAVKTAEQQTSGEVRVYIESKCTFVDALDRAKQIFFELNMDKTTLHNAVLVYVAMKDRQVAVYADEGIHTKTGESHWQHTVDTMISYFRQHEIVDGIIRSVLQIGEALQQHFPYVNDNDKNELPDDIVFGK